MAQMTGVIHTSFSMMNATSAILGMSGLDVCKVITPQQEHEDLRFKFAYNESEGLQASYLKYRILSDNNDISCRINIYPTWLLQTTLA